MDWLGDHLWAGWLALALVLGAAELASLDLVLLMLAVGAIAGAISAGIGLALVLPNLVRRLHTGPDLQLGHGKVVGHQALVTEVVTSITPGRVKLDGEIWSARPYDESLTIKAGETVEVLAMKGATVFVHPVNETLEP